MLGNEQSWEFLFSSKMRPNLQCCRNKFKMRETGSLWEQGENLLKYFFPFFILWSTASHAQETLWSGTTTGGVHSRDQIQVGCVKGKASVTLSFWPCWNTFICSLFLLCCGCDDGLGSHASGLVFTYIWSMPCFGLPSGLTNSSFGISPDA